MKLTKRETAGLWGLMLCAIVAGALCSPAVSAVQDEVQMPQFAEKQTDVPLQSLIEDRRAMTDALYVTPADKIQPKVAGFPLTAAMEKQSKDDAVAWLLVLGLVLMMGSGILLLLIVIPTGFPRETEAPPIPPEQRSPRAGNKCAMPTRY